MRRAQLGLVAMLASALAACGSGAASVAVSAPGSSAPPSPSDQQLLSQALAAWAGFPVNASPRPLVMLCGTACVNPPASGFSDGDDKLAFNAGSVNPPASWPAASPEVDGHPVVSAADAFGILTTSQSSGASSTTRLHVVSVQLGSASFDTDRGPQTLPAWLFAFEGVADPAEVLAVDPSSTFPVPPPSALLPNVASVLSSVEVGAGGLTLTVATPGAYPPGTGPCTASYALQSAASSTAVAIVVDLQVHPPPKGVGCALGGPQADPWTIPLQAPLGARVVVNAAGEAVAAVQGCPDDDCPADGGPTVPPESA